MSKNPLQKLADYGQSIWLDYIRRKMLASGELKQMIEEDGLRSVTVNPSILEKAISSSHDYDSAVQALALKDKREPKIYERLGVEDVQQAADLFRQLYEESQGKHGFVSLEVSPYLRNAPAGPGFGRSGNAAKARQGARSGFTWAPTPVRVWRP